MTLGLKFNREVKFQATTAKSYRCLAFPTGLCTSRASTPGNGVIWVSMRRAISRRVGMDSPQFPAHIQRHDVFSRT